MNILVTGCAGFVGSHLTQRFLSENNSVLGIDNMDPFYSVKAKERNLYEIKSMNKNFRFIEADITDDDKMKEIFSQYQFDKVVHIAARAGVRDSLEYPISYIETNIIATVRLLDLCKKHGIESFINCSSSSVYGTTNSFTLSESERADTPISPYAASKRSSELFSFTYSYLYGIKVVNLRFFTVYGPRQRPEMAIAKFTRMIDNEQEITIFGDGSTTRDYTYVDDIVEGIMLATTKNFDYEIFNLGAGKPVTIREVIGLIEGTLGKKAIIKNEMKNKADVDNTLANISKSRKYLGYIPKTNIEEGIKKYIEWYKQNKEYYTI